MGIVECDIHGWSAILPVCIHIVNDIQKKTEPKKLFSFWTYLADISDLSSFEEAMSMGNVVCEICRKDERLSEVSSILPNEEFGKLGFKNTTGICLQCFDDYIKVHDISWSDFMPDDIRE